MFVAIEKYRLPAQILLGAIAVSFVGFGVAQFDIRPNNQYIVKIGDQIVTRHQLDNTMRNTDSSRETVLRQLINRAYLLESAKQLGITVSDEQIKQDIVDTPEFHDANGKFDPQQFKNLLQSNGISEAQFMDMQREMLTIRAIENVFAHNIVSDSQATQLLNATMATRKLRNVGVNPDAFKNQVQIDDASLKKFYDANKKTYTLPQAVKYEFVRFSPKTLAEKETVSDEEITQAIKNAPTQSKRSVAHILIAFGDDKAQSKAQAEEIAKQLKTQPEKFAEFAKQHSQDPESAKNNGVIGEFSNNGDLINAKFKETAFGLPSGEVSNVIESDFGYHIIQAKDVNAIDSETQKAQIVQELKEKKAQQTYNKIREELTNLTFDTPNNLKTAADKVGLPLQTQNEWLTRDNAPATQVPTAVVDALFSTDVFDKKHNSEDINVNGETWFVRATETRAETLEPMDAVKERLIADFTRSESVRLAKEQAHKLFADLQAGKNPTLAWSETQEIAPEQMRGALSPDAFKTVMAAVPKNGKPAYVLIDNLGAPQIVEVQAIQETAGDKQTLDMMKQLLAQQTQRAAMSSAYLDYLSKHIKTEQGSEKVADDTE